jgi:putative salt-induced outer membrane protein
LEGILELGKANSVYETEFRAQNRIYQQLYLIFDVNYKYNQNVPDGNENEELSTGLNLQYAF